MPLPVLTFTAMVQQMAASLQGAATQLVDLSVGSVLRALLEANAALAQWLQWTVLQVLSATRAATSAGEALDSWMADYSLARLPASNAVGVVTFSRYSTGITAFVPVGTVVRASVGLQTFVVTVQSSNPDWNGSSGYTLPVGEASMDLPICSVVAGSDGNVQAGAIGILASPIAGIDSVLNATPTVGGMNAEADVALRARFQLYINSRGLATKAAILSAIANIRQGLRYSVLENQSFSGDREIGRFCAIVDDGTGLLPTELLTQVQAAIDAVRPIGSVFSVNPPVFTFAAVSLVLQTSNTETHDAVALTVQRNIMSWIYNLPIAATLAISKLEAIAHDSDLSVMSVTSALINGASSDLTAPPNGIIMASSVVVE